MKRIGATILAVCAALLTVASGVTPPPAPVPKQPNITAGGRAVAITVNPNDENKIIVASETGGLFRSTNHGLNWTQVSGSSTFWYSDVLYVPSNPDIIVATAYSDTRVVTGGGIWRSINGGGTWSQVALNPPSCSDSFIFGGTSLYAESGRDRLWAGTMCGLAYSDTQGASWTFLPEVTGYTHEPVFAVLAPSTTRLIIRTYAGLRISVDSGQSWALTSGNVPANSYIFPGAYDQIAVAPNNPDHLYWALNYSNNGNHVGMFRSTTNGSSWSTVFLDTGANRPPIAKTASALSGDGAQYDVYYSNGACALERATAEAGGSGLSAWTLLNHPDHCDLNDIAFSNDHKTPILMASDGGLHNTADAGANWAMVGAGKAGYNALQVTEVLGQEHTGPGADLYFGTQDNSIWASPDLGNSNTPANAGEGARFSLPRDFYPANQTQFTGKACGPPCWYFVTGPLMANQGTFPSAADAEDAPRLLAPGTYVQSTAPQNAQGSVFALTTNSGGNWNNRFSLPNWAWDLPKLSGDSNDPVLYIPMRTDGLTPDGYTVVGLERITDALGNNTPLVSAVTGYGSLGIYGNMMGSHESYGVDPQDPNFLIVADTIDKQVKVTTDGGATWKPDTALTDLVTQSGALKFSWSQGFSQTTAFAFDPECRGRILVGTEQAGVFETFDRGGTWRKIPNSERIPQVDSFFFPGDGSVVVSSYGRGLWQYFNPCPSGPLRTINQLAFAEPTIYWKGARIPISQIHDPDACPACVFFLVIGGKVMDYKTDPNTNALLQVTINKGHIEGYNWHGDPVPASFDVVFDQSTGGLQRDQQLQQFLRGRNDLKGLFTEGPTLRGLLIYTDDIRLDQFPTEAAPEPSIRLTGTDPRPIDATDPIVVTGAGFDPSLPLEVLLDGQPVAPDSPPDFDPQGHFTFPLTPALELGPHGLVIRQGAIQVATMFMVSTHDEDALVGVP